MTGEIRMSDDDRNRYNDVIKQAYADGRITDAELDERLTAVLSARYESELLPVVADLPNPPTPSVVPAPLPPPRDPPTVPEAHGDDARGHSVLGPAATPFLMAPIICTAIYVMTDPGGYFWPMWVWFGCSIPVLGNALSRRLDR